MGPPVPDKLILKYISIGDLEANDWNPQSMSKETFAALKKEISEVGFISPMQVVALEDGKYRILGGEHRWQAAKELGFTELPCGILPGKRWEEKDLQKAVTVRLNILSGHLDPEKFALLYQEMADKYGAESLQTLFGFTDAKAFAKVVGGVQKNLKKVLPKSMHGAIDAAAKEAKTVQDLSNIVQVMFAKHGESVGLSYMVFSFGGKNHLYVQMSPDMKKAMEVVTEYCRTTATDINELIGPLTTAWATEATKKLSLIPKYAKPGEEPLSDVNF